MHSLIRPLWPSAVFAVALVAPALAESIDVPKWKSFELSGEARIVKADGARIRLAPDASFRVTVPIPAPREVEGLDPEGWTLRLRVDAALVEGKAKLRVAVPDGSASTLRFDATKEAPTGVLERFFAAGVATEGGEFTLECRASSGTLDVTSVHLERYHAAPTRKLVGKANGKLGPDLIGCGAFGFTGLTEHRSTAFTVLEVEPKGIAAEAGLRPGDVVTHVAGEPLDAASLKPGWDWFERSHEARLGRAIEAAIVAGGKSVTLTVVRDAEWVHPIELPLPYGREDLAASLDGFPLTGGLADALRADLLSWALTNQNGEGTWKGTAAVNPAMGALALLATGDDAHLPAARRAIEFLVERNPRPSKMTGLAYWTIAYQGTAMCELYLRTKDESLLPWIREAIEWLPTTTHECKWGMQAFGHGPDGLPYDDKALMAPAAHLLVFEALARQCGVESRVWEHIEPYVRHSWSSPAEEGHGAMGYNASYKDKGEFWSRTGLCALAEVLRERAGSPTEEPMAQVLCVLMEERHPWMLNSHAYGEPGAALGLLALATVKRSAFDAILPQWRWRFLCAWEPGHGLRYSTPHMGAPYMGGESIVNLSYLLLLSVDAKATRLTGAGG